jgi:hypothetical protein
VNVVVDVTTHSQIQEQQVLKECELVKAKVAINWQIEKQMCVPFVHIIKELQGNDLVSQEPIESNGPLHSNWAGLPKPMN